MIHTCVPPGLYQTHALLQEHEHCRPPTLPCAASFLHQSATLSGPLHWKQDTQPPASAETCNSTVVDPPSPRLARWGDPLSRTDLRSCITAAAIASGRNRSAHFPPPKASKIARYSTRYICRRLFSLAATIAYLRLLCICIIAWDVSGGGACTPLLRRPDLECAFSRGKGSSCRCNMRSCL